VSDPAPETIPEVRPNSILWNCFRVAGARTKVRFRIAFPAALLLLSIILVAASSTAVSAAVPPREPLPAYREVEINRVIDRYVAATQLQRESMKGAQMEADIDGRLPGFDEAGNMSVLRKIDKDGEISYETMRSFEGDDRIKKDVIARYLEEEAKSHGYGALSFTREEYNFEIKAILREKTRSTFVFDVTPKVRRDDALEGEIWVDGETGMPLKEAVERVGSPSFWLTHLRTVRSYILKNGMSVIRRAENRANIRLIGAGSAEIDIDYSNVELPEDKEALAEPSTSAQAF
jgi:hypothetical protein